MNFTLDVIGVVCLKLGMGRGGAAEGRETRGALRKTEMVVWGILSFTF